MTHVRNQTSPFHDVPREDVAVLLSTRATPSSAMHAGSLASCSKRSEVEMTKTRSLHQGLLVIGLLLFAAGCSSPEKFREPVANFSAATATMVDGAQTYLLKSNTTERELAFIRSELDWGLPIDIGKVQDPLIPEDDLKLRLEALNSLKTYANLLGKAASSNIGASFEAEALKLGQSIDALAAKAASQSSNGLLAGSNTGSILGELAGKIGRAVIEEKQAAAIADTIIAAGPTVTKLVENIEKDMRLVFADWENAALIAMSTAVKDFYNARQKGAKTDKDFPYKERVAYMKAVRSVAVNLDEQRTINTTFFATLSRFNKALQSLVDFAKADRNPEKFPEVAVSIEIFFARAKDFFAAAEKFRALAA